MIVVKSLPAQVVGRWAALREVEGSSATEKHSAPISVFTEEIIVIVVLGLKFSLLLTRLIVDSPKNDKKEMLVAC